MPRIPRLPTPTPLPHLMATIGIALIGTGGIALANHLPGIALCPEARVVALCDAHPGALERAKAATGVSVATTDYREILTRDDVHAVIICTPNDVHAPLSIAAAKAGKHVLCEKPLAMDLAESRAMLAAAEAAKVRHMTAFTYRFVPAMVYMTHLVRSGALGTPWHFRAQRFQDWGRRNLGWRQIKAHAATGELGDMLSHRIDFGFLLAGRLARVVAQTRKLVSHREGVPSELDDWVGMLGEFASGTTGVWESTKLATGRGEGGRSHDVCEVNGSEGTAVYEQGRPHEILIGRAGGRELRREPVPREFQTWPGSSRDPAVGDPITTFRYDQDVEFIHAIRDGRPCFSSFVDGVRTQAAMEAVLLSERTGRWEDVPEV